MRIELALCLTALIVGSAVSEPVPRLLIVPLRKTAASQAPGLAIGNYVAQELDQDGRVSPIVWSLTDPTFRQSATSGAMKSMPDYPSKIKAFEGARALGATYILFYSTDVTAKKIEARVDLYEGKRDIWHDIQNSGMRNAGGLNGEDTNRSIAHTWSLLMLSQTLKALLPRPKVVTPTIERGQEPTLVSTSPSPPPDSVAIVFQKVAELQKAGKLEQAVTLVRDSIDADPFNPKLRMLVVSLYEQQKNWIAAADAAKRGSDVIPDDLELRRASLRDLIVAGKSQDAQDQLNEIIARDSTSENSLMMQSQTYMILGKYGKASETLDGLVKKYPKPNAYYWRALCRSTLGGSDGVNSDVQEYLKAPLTGADAEQSCKESERILQSVTQKDIELALSLYQQAGIHPDSLAVKDQLDQLMRDATARGQFLQQMAASASLHESYGALLLAQKLLMVSFVSLQDVLKSGSDDSMVDARINLGEAMKTLKSSKQKLAAELGDSEFVGPSVDNS